MAIALQSQDQLPLPGNVALALRDMLFRKFKAFIQLRFVWHLETTPSPTVGSQQQGNLSWRPSFAPVERDRKQAWKSCARTAEVLPLGRRSISMGNRTSTAPSATIRFPSRTIRKLAARAQSKKAAKY